MSTASAVLPAATTARAGVPERRRGELVLLVLVFGLTLAATLPDGSGWLRSGLALALLLLAPTAQSLARRIVQNVAMAMPLLVLTVWLPLGDAAVPVLLSVSVAVVVAFGVRTGWRHLVPGSTTTDSLTLLLVGGVAAIVGSPFIAGDTPSTLARLMRGWDHASHFDMYLAFRTGVALDTPGGGDWYFAHYPQFFHALLAQTSELVWGPAGSLSTELTRYSWLQPVVFTTVVLMVVAALLDAIPRSDRQRHAFAVLFTCTLLFAFPGASLLVSGHLNFLLSAAAASVLLVLGNRRDRPFTTAHVVAMGSLVVVAASWPLLLPCVALPALRTVITGLRTTQTRYWTAPVAVGVVVASLYLVLISAGSDPVAHLVTAGGLVHPSLASTVVVLLALLAATSHPRVRRRAPDLSLATVSSVVLLSGIAVVQLVQTGSLGYYFWKASLGVELVLLLAVAPHAAVPWRWSVRVLRPRLGPRPAAALTLGAFALVGVVALSQLPIGALALYAVAGTPEPPPVREVSRQLLAVAHDDSLDAASTTFVAKAGGRVSPALTNQWYHSLTRTRTVEAARFDELLDAPTDGSAGPPMTTIVDLTRSSQDRLVVADPQQYHQVRGLVAADDLDRLVPVPRP